MPPTIEQSTESDGKYFHIVNFVVTLYLKQTAPISSNCKQEEFETPECL